MINTKLSSQVATQRTDLKNDLNLTKDKEKLSPNELLTQNLRQKLGLSKQMPPPNEALQKFAQNELNQKLQEIVNKLLNQISTHKNPNSPILKQANLLNFAPNFVNELKLLSKELSKNENFAPLLNKIEMLLKPASEIKAKDLAPLLKNSGVFFEAKLKNALNEELLPKSFYKLINAIKSLSSEKIATQIATLADKSLSAKDSLRELANIMIQNKNENKNIVSHSTFKPLLELSQKLDNFKKYINKNPQLAESKIGSLAQNFAKELAKIKDDFIKILSKPENLLVKDPVLLKQAMQSFEKLQNHLDKIIQKAESGVKIENEDLLKELLESQDEPLKTKGELKTQDEPEEHIKEHKEELKGEKEKNENEEEIERELEKEEVQKEDFSKDEKLENAEENVGENLEKDTEKNAENLDKEVVKKQADIKEEPKEQKHQAKEIAKEQAKEIAKEQVREYPKEALKGGVKQEDRVQIPQNKAQESIFKQQEFTKEVFKNLAFKAPQGQNLEGLENLSKDITTLNRKINENLKQLDPLAQNAKLNLNELKGLENKLIGAVKDLQNIRLKNVQDVSYEIQNDIKSTLLQVASQAKAENNDAIYNQANRLLAQIEMNQLMSLANDSINTYLPFSWEDLNESKIIFRRGKKDKFFAQIKLEFAKLGDLEILVSLNNEKYIDINIMAENKEFRKMIYENAHELKRNINKAGLLSSNFFVGDIIRSHFDPRDLRNYDLQMGMDKKV
ncbi:flagellar hook-length control protein FliK [Campylobacter upsaliensis]|uniref:flagellar hook-length control protein FliK n=1 Tax=Campylobacter upsaliensis TaxID=28080 RepID=UPI00128A50E1|nr:flagellar hook-length control protein FliK [Campylobacter upsaliensis]EAK0456302.1 flagellar hook-length control protein FliK [Campylobacter upsaliensis]EAK9949115.1 flagellar hook-length control protein FliK [Campylobacter upsaliensis]ECL5231447.1 flagellar hook-length control protein FliK [Campylobacter upsaliensis]EHE1098443.1 flagellar hook-length control protein FliK [Campylobacter upsaliensis]EHE1473647.1 flagellar hook-length control protein FliK [Campylobacter upsaliensis]